MPMRSGAFAVLAATGLSLAMANGAGAGDADFCGRDGGEPAALQDQITKASGVKEIYRGPDYVAYQDEVSQAVYTFTLAAVGPAHPAAVCRKPVREGDSITLQMVVVCRGETDACQRLESDFKLLNAKMEAAVRSETAQAGDKK